MTTTTGAESIDSGLPTTWWVKGLALTERISASAPRPAGPVERDLLEPWRISHGTGLTERLAASGLDETALAGLITENPERLATRVNRPAWADLVERAIDAPEPVTGEVPANWAAAFAVPLRPLVRLALSSITAGPGVDGVALAAVTGTVTAWLNRRLVSIAVRTFVLELHRRRPELTGDDPHARFADFVRRLAEPGGLAGVFTRYPVLARLLGETCRQTASATAELLSRFDRDRADLVATVLGGTDPGALVAIEPGQGDTHQHGRSVTMLRFAGGAQVIYRPRDVESHVRLAEMARLLDLAGLRTCRVLARPGYGWLEYILHRPTEPHQVDSFYRRQGALLALLHALDGADIHYENLIACGDQPVLVDTETLFHPTLPAPGTPADPAAAALAASVHRTAMLPVFLVGETGALDLSGMGGGAAGAVSPVRSVGWDDAGTDRMRLARRPAPVASARNQPAVDGGEVDPLAYEPALLEGFRLGYDAIMLRRQELTELVSDCADLEIRVVVRPTNGYATLLDESTHPDLLRDALDRDRVFGVLARESADDPIRSALVHHEITDLWAGDVPLFLGRPGAADLWASTGVRLPAVLKPAGVPDPLRKLAHLGTADRRDQEWIITATLATRRPDAIGHRGAEWVEADAAPGPAVHPERMLTAACAIADHLVATGLTGGGRVNWLGLELVGERQWLVLPMGAGLATGHVGAALFLAQLAELSGVGRYAEQARAAISAVPALLESLAVRPDLVALVGRGGLRGLGGIAYGLARLSVLLDDPEPAGWTATAVRLASQAPDSPGWAGGSAGCLAAMTAVHAELGLPAAEELAEECADRTAELVRREPALPGGFADGWAGVAFAMAGDPPLRDAARTALARSMPEADESAAWCAGTAGRLLAATAVSGTDPEQAASVLTGRPVLRDLSLCHGELGIVEVLTELAAENPSPATVAARRHRAAAVLGTIDRFGPTCGTPGGVSTPGFLNGLAGIGYGLLRLGFAHRVPSALLLRPRPEAR